MIRNLKVLGLALVAICAMSAMVASAASAVPSFTSANYSATITGTGGENASEKFVLNAADHSQSVECKTSNYHGSLAAASSTLTVAPSYENCKAFGFLEAEVNPEGCKYVFHATEKVAAGKYKAHVDITCPTGQSIKINAGNCKTEVKAQEGLTTASINNNASDVSVTAEFNEAIAYTVTQDGFFCPLTGTGNKTGASYSSSPITVSGSNGAISVSGE